MKRALFIFLIILAAVVVFWLVFSEKTIAPVEPVPTPVVVQPVPAQKDDLIMVTSPLPDASVSSPLVIKGMARGNWFFEASFPVTLTNWDGLIIASGVAQAQGEWMTTDYVPFEATLTFQLQDTTVSDAGYLILQKDNASGDPAFDNALEFRVHLN